MEYQLTRFRLDHICELINGGQLALPDFQRDFVWPPSKAADLLQSIAREWPVGSLLILEGPTEFACKPIELGPEAHGPNVKYYILDGQQRITSIYHAIQDVSDYVYYIDMKSILNSNTEEDFILYSKRRKFDKDFKNCESTASAGIIKIYDLYETERFFEWLNFIEDPISRRDYTKLRRDFLYGLNAGVYSIPATQLPRDVEFSALAKIFEGLNTNAVRLTTSDLLIAANLPKGINLKNLWSTFSDSLTNPLIEEFELIDILKICVLIESNEGRYSGGIKQSELIKIQPDTYRKNWSRATEILKESINYATNHLGVLNKTSLPSSSNIIALGFLIENKLNREKILCNWIHWIVDETFSHSTHTRLITEIKSKKTEWNSRDINFILNKYRNEFNTIQERQCGSNAYLTRGVISLNLIDAMNKNIITTDDFKDISVVNKTTRIKFKNTDNIGDIKVAIRRKQQGLDLLFKEKCTMNYERIEKIIEETIAG